MKKVPLKLPSKTLDERKTVFSAIFSLPQSRDFISLEIPLVLGAILYFWFANNQLTVTNKRIFGKVAFGKRVDLPLDSVSAVALTTVFVQGISVSSSSGRITFYYIPERQAVHKAISDLLLERQIKSKEPMIKQEIQQSSADELKNIRICSIKVSLLKKNLTPRKNNFWDYNEKTEMASSRSFLFSKTNSPRLTKFTITP